MRSFTHRGFPDFKVGAGLYSVASFDHRAAKAYDLRGKREQQVRYRPSENVVERRIRGEHVLVPIMGSLEQLDSIYTLNETAGLVYTRAASGADAPAIAAEIARIYRVTPAQARADVDRVLRDLVHIGALAEVKD